MKNYLLILSIIGFSGCSTKEDYLLFNQTNIHQAAAQKGMITEVENVQFEYKILPHDRLSVNVYKHPDLSTTNMNIMQLEQGILVNSKGDIRLPLIRNIHVAGLTQTEAEATLTNAFRTYLKQPDVQIEVLNKRAYIVGEVNTPGEIPLVNERLTLLQMLAKAGDIKDTANRKSILILRGGGTAKVHTEIVNLTDVNSIRTANLMIKPNDIVYVMPNDMKAFNTRVNEIDPIFNLISHVLTPFVSIKFLSN
ncbi:polysaccharide export protein [bacterium]|nr:polysaccharide export protein [bacterium]MBU1958920.1 polysaccharide export protein [bacterium]